MVLFGWGCVCVCILLCKSIFSVSQESGRGIADEVHYFYKFHFGAPDCDFSLSNFAPGGINSVH